jgi:predicted Zn-dependent protease
MDRIPMLNEILAQDPNNAFARYGLAVEYSNSGKLEQAIEEFKKLLAANPDYAAGYFMAAQTLMKSDRRNEARTMLENGIIAAQRKGDSHAASEMQGMLEEISSER